ncbi:nucleoside deaminase [Chromobacterium sp. CV08]|uniref:nucleoside deaminase n=1 Tax=Chromobacterium sp. CV08 TaxID=3133274 RepID=UPI003DA92085
MDRRTILLGSAAALLYARASPAWASGHSDRHRDFMRLAIQQARRNTRYPFGAVIVHEESGRVLAEGVNNSGAVPFLHGEMAAIQNYCQRHGNRGFSETTLYTTAEPCPMCMSAIMWSGIPRVVWGTSINGLIKAGYQQILIPAERVARASTFYQSLVLTGGVLEEQTDALFLKAYPPDREDRERDG